MWQFWGLGCPDCLWLTLSGSDAGCVGVVWTTLTRYAACRKELGPAARITLYEASNRVGGHVESIRFPSRQSGRSYLFERGCRGLRYVTMGACLSLSPLSPLVSSRLACLPVHLSTCVFISTRALPHIGWCNAANQAIRCLCFNSSKTFIWRMRSSS